MRSAGDGDDLFRHRVQYRSGEEPVAGKLGNLESVSITAAFRLRATAAPAHRRRRMRGASAMLNALSRTVVARVGKLRGAQTVALA